MGQAIVHDLYIVYISDTVIFREIIWIISSILSITVLPFMDKSLGNLLRSEKIYRKKKFNAFKLNVNEQRKSIFLHNIIQIATHLKKDVKKRKVLWIITFQNLTSVIHNLCNQRRVGGVENFIITPILKTDRVCFIYRSIF